MTRTRHARGADVYTEPASRALTPSGRRKRADVASPRPRSPIRQEILLMTWNPAAVSTTGDSSPTASRNTATNLLQHCRVIAMGSSPPPIPNPRHGIRATPGHDDGELREARAGRRVGHGLDVARRRVHGRRDFQDQTDAAGRGVPICPGLRGEEIVFAQRGLVGWSGGSRGVWTCSLGFDARGGSGPCQAN